MDSKSGIDIAIGTDGSFTPAVLPFAGNTVFGVLFLDGINTYRLTTGASLSSSATISTSIPPYKGLHCKVLYSGSITSVTGSSTITFFGKALTFAQLSQNLVMEATYGVNGSAWFVEIRPAQPLSSDIPGADVTAITLSGTSIVLNVGISHQNQIITGSGTLTGNVTVAPGAVAGNNNKYVISYEATLNVSTFSVVIMGYTLTAAEAAAGALIVTAVWTGAGYNYTTQPGVANFPTQNVGLTSQALVAGGGTTTLKSGVNKQTLEITGSNVTLSGNTVINGTAVYDGDWFEVFYKATAIMGSNTITIFGYPLNAQQMLSGDVYVKAVWSATASAWIATATFSQSGITLYEVYVANISVAAVKALFASPLLLAPPPGAGLMHDPIDFIPSITTYGTTPYDTHTTLTLITGDANTNPSMIEANCLLSTVAKYCKGIVNTTVGASKTVLVPNSGLYLSALTGNPATGDSLINCRVTYLIKNA